MACASEVVRLKVANIGSAQRIIRVVQSKGRKDRNVGHHFGLRDRIHRHVAAPHDASLRRRVTQR
jgi:site-specific recombinase XerD